MTTHREKVIEAARRYLQQGFGITPLAEKSKRPILDDWVHRDVSEDLLESLFPIGSPNIGIRLGEASGGIIDIDLDCDEARALVLHLLPRTEAYFGKSSTPQAHFLYKCSPVLDTLKFQHPEMGMIVEIRSTGAQTMVPPSVHPSGESVTFVSKGCQPAEVDPDLLLRRVTLLAICVVALKYYPIKGMRNEFALALAGSLLRVGCWTAEEIEKAVQGVSYLADDEEWQERIKVVRTTQDKLSKGEPVTGFPALGKLIGTQNTEIIKKWCKKLNPDGLGYDDVNAEQLIETMNKQYAFVLLGGKGMIMKFPPGKDHAEPEFLTIAGFRDYFQNRIIQNPLKKKTHTYADYWLTHPKRRTYEGIIFAPKQGVEGYYNYWQGFAIEPIEGDCSKFLWHAKYVICGGNETCYAYLMAWFASIIQEPDKKVGTSLVIRGKQGTGKSIFVKYFSDLLGHYYMVAEDPRYITGRFNGHLIACMLLHAEEGFWAGDKTAEGMLKEMITGSHLNIELKGKEPFKVKNYIRLIVTGNPNWVVPAAFEERRFFVLEASEAHMQDHPYFIALAHEMNNGGREALLHYLQNYDYSQINLRQIPKTAALFDQKIASMDGIAKWWLDVLMKGRLPRQDSWSRNPGAEDAVTDYCEHASRTGERRRAIETEFGKRFAKLVPSRVKRNGTYKTRTYDGMQVEMKGYYYELPSLSEARRQFEEQVGQEIDWDDVPAEVTPLRRGAY